MPAHTSFVLRELVSEEKSPRSSIPTRNPRAAASRLVPQPEAPPPMTKRSNSSSDFKRFTWSLRSLPEVATPLASDLVPRIAVQPFPFPDATPSLFDCLFAAISMCPCRPSTRCRSIVAVREVMHTRSNAVEREETRAALAPAGSETCEQPSHAVKPPLQGEGRRTSTQQCACFSQILSSKPTFVLNISCNENPVL